MKLEELAARVERAIIYEGLSDEEQEQAAAALRRLAKMEAAARGAEAALERECRRYRNYGGADAECESALAALRLARGEA